jgi:hypothetical protein
MYAGFSQFGPALAGVVGSGKLQLVSWALCWAELAGGAEEQDW